MVYRWLAAGVIAVHLLYLLYLVAGGFVAWRWPRTFALHLLTVLWACLSVFAHVPCPLTWLQDELRVAGGQPTLAHNFIDTYVRGVFFPANHLVLTQVLVATAVLVSWVGLAVIRSAHRGARVAG